MATNVEVPYLGRSVGEVVLVKWHKGQGQAIISDEPLVVLETDKQDVELPSPATGVVRQASDEGDTVSAGQIIGRIDDMTIADASGGPVSDQPATGGSSPPCDR
jgi:pyruvate/2-oxoglutarate dehydrogenase complex dihydrolipoamide acyltransferase (E2) component